MRSKKTGTASRRFPPRNTRPPTPQLRIWNPGSINKSRHHIAQGKEFHSRQIRPIQVTAAASTATPSNNRRDCSRICICGSGTENQASPITGIPDLDFVNDWFSGARFWLARIKFLASRLSCNSPTLSPGAQNRKLLLVIPSTFA